MTDLSTRLWQNEGIKVDAGQFHWCKVYNIHCKKCSRLMLEEVHDCEIMLADKTEFRSGTI